MATARILIPLILMLLVYADWHLQGSIAMANAARVIEACEHYRQSNGTYPERLDDLVPRYLSSVPRAKYCLEASQFEYEAEPERHVLLWHPYPMFARKFYIFEIGEWHFID